MKPAQHEAITFAPATDTRVCVRDAVKGKGGREGSWTEQYRLYLTCDMYKSSLRHIHDTVLLSLEVEVFFTSEWLLVIQVSLDGGRRRSYFFQLDISYLPGQSGNKLEITSSDESLVINLNRNETLS